LIVALDEFESAGERGLGEKLLMVWLVELSLSTEDLKFPLKQETLVSFSPL
jgi:hypothetical protein